MRPFRDALGRDYDLDDPATYADLPQTIEAVKDRLFKEIGYAMVYMERDDWCSGPVAASQRYRVMADICRIAFGWDYPRYRDSLQWWQERLFLFLDEIENMC